MHFVAWQEEYCARHDELPDLLRKDKMSVDAELLRRLQHDCDVWVQQKHEKLSEKVASIFLLQNKNTRGVKKLIPGPSGSRIKISRPN